MAWFQAEDVGLLAVSGCIHSDLGVCTIIQEELLGLASDGVVGRALLIVTTLLVICGHEHVILRIGIGLLVHVLVFGGRHLDVFQASYACLICLIMEAIEGSYTQWCLLVGACEILRGIDSLH